MCLRPLSILKAAFAAIALLVTFAPSAQAERSIVAFATEKPAQWKPFLNAPAAGDLPNGLRFPLPFANPKNDRAAWDRALGVLDLSAAAAFTLDLQCADPASMRHLGLYFKSGDGWYVCNRPLPQAGVQRMVFHKGDFSTEGKVAGWNRVSAVRLSAWRGIAGRNAQLDVFRLGSLEGPLVVAQGTSSCRDAGEKAVAKTSADRVSKLLVDAGIGHRLATDDELPALLARPETRAVLLPYNPHPSAALLAALKKFLARGGKLGVFYGAEPALAQAMGFRLGAWRKEDRPDQWRSMKRLVPMAAVPEVVAQHSSNMMPATPAAPDAQILATWCNAQGKDTGIPAIVLSDKGFWMSHVLLGDDMTEKRDLLIGLCGRLDPRTWEDAARYAARIAGTFPPYSSLPGALAGISAAIDNAPRDVPPARPLLRRAESLSPLIGAALDGKRYCEAWQLATSQRRLLMRTDAMLQPSKPGEFVGIWDHEGTGWIPGDWPSTARQLKTLGVNAVFANFAWGGCAHYASKVVPPSNTHRLYGDQVAAARAATAANGQQLHAWVVLWKLDGAPADFIAKMRAEKRLLLDDAGKETGWLDPHDLRNRQLMKDLVAELAQTHPTLDGIHLDYVRLPGARAGFTAAARSRFEAASGRKVAKWPADVAPGGPRAAEWRAWRTQDITRFVEDVRARLRRVAPGMKLSAAVYGTADTPDGGSIAQYWPPWLERDLVDFVAPMDYTESEAEFENLLRRQTALRNAAGRIYPGIGATAIESRLDATQVARQVLLARRLGCPGFVLFSLSATTRDDILPELRLGLLAAP